jgi:hypothetical protein
VNLRLLLAMGALSEQRQFEIGALAMVFYVHNTGADQFVADVYSADIHPNYRAEKVAMWQRGPTLAIGALDIDNTRKLLGIIADRWAKAAAETLDTR